jgi:hypothetical protein
MNNNGFIIIIVVVVVLVILGLCMKGWHRRRRVENEGYDGKEKYILYYSNGGLIHNLSRIIKQIDLAKKYNRTLLIYSKLNEFQIDFDDLFYIDDPELTYKTDKDFGSVNGELLINNEIPFKHYKDIEANWGIIPGNMGFRYKDKTFLGIDHNEDQADVDIVIYKHLLLGSPGALGIKIQPTILQQIQAKSLLSPYIGIHHRNTDHKNDINKSFKQIHKQLKKHKHIKTLFLATDDHSSVDKFRNEFNDKIDRFICYNTIDNNGGPIHGAYRTDNKKLQQHVDALTDMYLLYKSDVFIPSENGSWGSFIKNLRNNKYSFFKD